MVAPKGHAPYSGCETGGRPTKYTKEIIENLADEFLEWLKVPTHVWFKDFCLDKDILPSLMAEWADINEKFSAVHKIAKEKQESRLINGGLTSRYNANIVKFVLGNAHAWSERQETKISGDVNNPLEFILKNIDGKTKELVDEEE